jgi:hypothetical protein
MSRKMGASQEGGSEKLEDQLAPRILSITNPKMKHFTSLTQHFPSLRPPSHTPLNLKRMLAFFTIVWKVLSCPTETHLQPELSSALTSDHCGITGNDRLLAYDSLLLYPSVSLNSLSSQRRSRRGWRPW